MVAALLTVLAALEAPAAAAEQAAGLHRLLAAKLFARSTIEHRAEGAPPEATDFSGQGIGCITLTGREMRSFGYAGHAFACQESVQGEVLGAVLDRRGRTLCFIDGAYRGDSCYGIRICDVSETLCVR